MYASFQKLQKVCLESVDQGGIQLENHSPLMEKITCILWMAFCNAGTVTNLKTRELLQLLKWLQICTVLFSDGLAQL